MVLNVISLNQADSRQHVNIEIRIRFSGLVTILREIVPSVFFCCVFFFFPQVDEIVCKTGKKVGLISLVGAEILSLCCAIPRILVR